MYSTSSSIFIVSHACTNGYWCTISVSRIAAISSTLSIR